MRNVRSRTGAAVALLMLSLACADTPEFVEPSPEALKPPAFPQVPAGSVLYVRSDSTAAGGLVLSRYVLHPDSTMSLQFSSVQSGVIGYPGKYRRADSLIALDFRDPGALGRWEWEAVGTLRGDSLYVVYNAVMAFDDFVNGAYVKEH